VGFCSFPGPGSYSHSRNPKDYLIRNAEGLL
jgi:hypothetical protein